MNADIKAALGNLNVIRRYIDEAEDCLFKARIQSKNEADNTNAAIEALSKIRQIHEDLLIMASNIRIYLQSELTKPKTPKVLLGFWWFEGMEINVLNDSSKSTSPIIDKMVIIPKNKKGANALDRMVKKAKDDFNEHICRNALVHNRKNLLIGSAATNGEIRKMIYRQQDALTTMSAMSFYDFVCISPWPVEKDIPEEAKEEILKIVDYGKQQDVPVIVSYKKESWELQENANIAFYVKELYRIYDYLDKTTVEEILFSNPIRIMQLINDTDIAGAQKKTDKQDRVFKDISMFSSPITPENIMKTVCEYYNVTIEEIKTQVRSKKFMIPRRMIMYLCRTLTSSTYKEIASLLNARDYTAVMYGERAISDCIDKDEKIRNDVERILEMIKMS